MYLTGSQSHPEIHVSAVATAFFVALHRLDMHISRYALFAGVRHRVRTGEVQRGWPEGLPESGLKRHGVPEAPPDTSRGRVWPCILDVWRGGLQNGSNQGNTNLFYISVKAVSKYFN